MARRRPHTKSRHGCSQCKKNRTKCDEVKPRCGRCERIGMDCSLVDQAADWIFIPAKNQQGENSTASPSSSSQSNGRSVDSQESLRSVTNNSTPRIEKLDIGSQLSDPERDRLRLMTHYTLHTSKTISEITIPEHRDQNLWSNWVTELAFENEFLLHGLLSLSALHLATRGISRQKHMVLAIHHHGLGVASFRPQLSNITAENYDAVFAFSCIVALYNFGIQRYSSPEMNQVAKFFQVLTLIRGSSVIVKSDFEVLKASRWSILVLQDRLENEQTLPDDMEAMLATLLRRTSTTISASTQKETYTSAIGTLRENLAIAVKHKGSQLALTLFSLMSPPDYWAMVCIGEPLALAILANYAVILYWLRGNVWMQGWGKDTIDAIRKDLAPEWRECIEWAVRETEKD